MHRLAVLLVVAACDLVPPPASAPTDAANVAARVAAVDAAQSPADARSPDAVPPAAPAAPTPAPGAPVFAKSLATAAHPPQAHVIVAAPSQLLRALAVTQDGSAAVSSDTGGAVRLWPTLDGTREPVVVAMRRPVSLAIARDGEDFEIAGIDGAGQLELAWVDANGAPAYRTSVELPRPATAVHALAGGFLVERDDQHLVRLARRGTIEGELEPPPGSHVAAIAVHGDTALALLDGGSGMHVRKLLAINGLTWDAPTPVLPIAARGIALAPSHKKIAAVIADAKSTRLALFDLARGRRVLLGPDNGFVDPTLEPVGFLDEETVVVRSFGTLVLWHATADDNSVAGVVEQRRAPAIAVGGEHAVIGSGASLSLADRSGTLHYLGFRVPSVAMVAGGPYSVLASEGTHVMRLGADLQEHASYSLPEPAAGGYYIAALLDGAHVLLGAYGQQHPSLDIVAIDTMQLTPAGDETELLAYDPIQRLAAFRAKDAVRFRRFDSKTGTFGASVELPVDSETSSVAFGSGDRVYVTSTYVATYTVRTLRAVRPERGTLKVADKREGQLQFEGEGVALPEPNPDVVTHTVASPDGTLVATYGDGRLTLRDATGTVRWTVPNGGAGELVWLRTGELLATGGGLARIDLATGAFADRRCGWEFGLWPEPVDGFSSATLCDSE